ncbi:hypothetical protein [Mangrovitalea sediminis]|nr:hypothetical protein [Mangrovitalea sediminis]
MPADVAGVVVLRSTGPMSGNRIAVLQTCIHALASASGEQR